MITQAMKWFTVAEDLAGTTNRQLRKGLLQGAAEALMGAIPYVCMYFVLMDVVHNKVTLMRTLVLMSVMFAALAVQIAIGIQSMLNIMIGSNTLFGQARLRIADHIHRLPMGWLEQQKSGVLTDLLTSRLNLLADIWSLSLIHI